MGFSLDSIGESLSGVGGSLMSGIIIFVIGVAVLAVVIGVGFWAMKRKKWNLRVEIKMPRSGGRLVLSEPAKGHFDIEAGIVDIKRKKLRAVGMKPFDVRQYLQGNNFLEVIQIGPKDYLPVLPKSYSTLKNKKGEEFAVTEIEADFGEAGTWASYAERAAKNRFSIIGFLDKHWRAVEISIILFVVFLGISILWMRMPSICG